MRYIKYLLFFPLSLFADTLSTIEIDKLVEHAFYSDAGRHSESIYRWNKPIHLFINSDWDGKSADRTNPTGEELDEIKKVTDEINQLTGIVYYIHEEPHNLEQRRALVFGKDVGHANIDFITTSKYMPFSGQAAVMASANRARVFINIHYRKSNGQDFPFVLHHIREELTNAIGMLGDTMTGTDPYSALEGTANHFATQFSEMDRRNIYAFYAMDEKRPAGSFETSEKYNEEEFRKKVAQVEIDHNIVYGGLFEGQVDPEQTDYERTHNPPIKANKKTEVQAKVEPKVVTKVEPKVVTKVEPEVVTKAETKTETTISTETGATNVDWLYFNHYPWVYSNKTNSWYYMLPKDEGMYVWCQLDNQWSKMSDAFGIN
tara:strand:- start:548 stop:1669 length:1122 start_codon:yes stop_codon:yes gene_type:complete